MSSQTKIDQCTERCDLVDLLNEYRRERVQPPPRTPESQVPTDAPDYKVPTSAPAQEPQQQENPAPPHTPSLTVAPAPTPAPAQEPQQETRGEGEVSGGDDDVEVCWGEGFLSVLLHHSLYLEHAGPRTHISQV